MEEIPTSTLRFHIVASFFRPLANLISNQSSMDYIRIIIQNLCYCQRNQIRQRFGSLNMMKVIAVKTVADIHLTWRISFEESISMFINL